MNFEQYSILLAKVFLSSNEEKRTRLKGRLLRNPTLKQLFDAPMSAGKVTLGGDLESGWDAEFFEWVEEISKEQITQCQWVSANLSSLDAHLSNAFAGGIGNFLRVQTKKREHFFSLNFFQASQFSANGEDFKNLISAQEHATILWSRCREMILESFQANAVKLDVNWSAERFLEELGKQGLWDYLSSQILSEIQIEAKVLGVEFEIPEDLKNKFVRSEGDSFMRNSSEEDYYFFYNVNEVSCEQAIHFLEAQESFLEILESIVAATKLTGATYEVDWSVDHWKVSMQRAYPLLGNAIVSLVSRGVSDWATKNKKVPLIPNEQKGLWGPSVQDRLRAQWRGKISATGYFFAPEENPWQYFKFTKIPKASCEVLFASASSALTPAQVEGDLMIFLDELQKIEAFAKKAKSPFAEAFRLASVLWKQDLPKGDLSESHQELVQKWADANAFQGKAIKVIFSLLDMHCNLQDLEIEASQLRQWLALRVSNVFGGMGSWNDQNFETHELQSEYEEVSKNFFRAHQKLNIVLLNN